MASRNADPPRAALGIDAAWTSTHPSGVALVVEATPGHWRCAAIAPDYRSFIAQGGRSPTPGTSIDTVMTVARRLAEPAQLSVVAVDMPLSRHPIAGRRCSDLAVSRAFGPIGCSTHSPSRARPGPISARLRNALQHHGFALATKDGNSPAKALLETYPHPAIVALLGLPYRFEYKVSRANRYWPGVSVPVRIERLLQNFRQLRTRLAQEIGGIGLQIPDTAATLAALKPIEDQLDALVCAWVAIEHLAGRTLGHGDDESAIWLPEMPSPSPDT